MAKTITVISSPTGQVQIKPEGFSGGACLEATKRLENMLGGQITERKETAEMYAAEVSTSVEATNG